MIAAIGGLIAIFLFYYAERVQILSVVILLYLLFISFFNGQFYAIGNDSMVKTITTLMVVFISFIAALHLIPGIDNPILIGDINFTQNAPSIDIYANIDKGFAGLCLVLVLCTINFKKDTFSLSTQRIHWLLIPLYIALMMGIGLLGGLDWDIKWYEATAVFFVCNLFFTVITEEVFFRGLIQGALFHVLKEKIPYSPVISILLASLIFGLAHIGGGVAFSVLATIAGIFYGLAYYFTGRLSAAIVAHIGVNMAHIIFLEYPISPN